MIKSDHQQIEDHIDFLKPKLWLSPDRAWWPEHLFHCTDINNALSILKDEQFLSRSIIEKRDKKIIDIASRQIINDTDEKWKQYVRLYFRPRTPTQYQNEGFRPKNEIKLDAYCPFPIYFVFDSKRVLTTENILFSKGNLWAQAEPEVGSSAAFFKSIPFEHVYHDQAIPEGRMSSIIYHRCAEVIIPNELSLQGIKMIYCRSQAEYETFIYLLKSHNLEKWIKRVGVSNKHRIFFKQWTFVQEATLTRTSIDLIFHPQYKQIGPFKLDLTLTSGKGKNYQYIKNDFMAGSAYSQENRLFLSLPKNIKNTNTYRVTLKLDGYLAYQNSYNDISD